MFFRVRKVHLALLAFVFHKVFGYLPRMCMFVVTSLNPCDYGVGGWVLLVKIERSGTPP